MTATLTVTIFGCKEYLKHIGFITEGDLAAAKPRIISIVEIQTEVARYFKVPMNELLSPRRSACVTRPRQIAMYLCKVLTAQSLPQIGRKFDRDHTTVMHAYRVIENHRKSDRELDAAVREIRRLITAPNMRVAA